MTFLWVLLACTTNIFIEATLARCAIKSRTGALFGGRARLVFVVRAGAPFGAPFHTCARVWRAFQYSGYFIVDLQNFDRNSVLMFCFAISCVPQVVKIRKFPVSDSGLCIGAQKRPRIR